MSYLHLSHLATTIREMITECADVGQLLHEKGWAEGNGGNLSIRLEMPLDKWWISEEKPEIISKYPLQVDFPNLNGQFVLIKGAGKRMRDIIKKPDQTLCIGKAEGKEFHTYWPTNKTIKPSSEINSHLAIQNYLIAENKTQNTVLHSHPTELIAMSNLMEVSSAPKLNYFLKSVNPSVSIFLPEGIGYIPFEIPTSVSLMEKTMNIIDKYNLILWAKHGVICKGSNLMECFDLIDIVNKSAKYLLATNQFTLNLLDEDTIDAIEQHFHGE
ncbi:MAG: rhamnulose-1-phosphate aldolase [Asgard group archaeon]|nr:rhamnulose-1-phosphate aldolase [Asgard group archaeon]